MTSSSSKVPFIAAAMPQASSDAQDVLASSSHAALVSAVEGFLSDAAVSSSARSALLGHIRAATEKEAEARERSMRPKERRRVRQAAILARERDLEEQKKAASAGTGLLGVLGSVLAPPPPSPPPSNPPQQMDDVAEKENSEVLTQPDAKMDHEVDPVCLPTSESGGVLTSIWSVIAPPPPPTTTTQPVPVTG